ncbi:hypothetical protein BDZ91DRAFT_751427 [Kalaharituber pfeilii]|nr:hypothetical protein BDZ91DRAFT_751427 [Kalaharituber pfeilii]
MSEPIPESIPTSMDPHSVRPQKKKRLLSPTSQQSQQLSTLFKKPDRVISVAPPKPKTLPPPPEIVANVQGSSAGAGSGEFHVYKASRRREGERIKLMEEELRKEKETKEFEHRMEEMRRRDEEKTEKRRRKREKKKGKAKNGGKSNGGEEDGEWKADGEKAKDGQKWNASKEAEEAGTAVGATEHSKSGDGAVEGESASRGGLVILDKDEF